MNTNTLETACSALLRFIPDARPKCGIILGSGMGGIADIFRSKSVHPYETFCPTGNAVIAGHEGRLILGERAGIATLVFCGRRHYYEGAGWEPLALPVYLLKRLGARVIVLTNAAGAIRNDLEPGDLMVIDDHINAMGTSPLVGNTDPMWGARFADQSRVYDPELRDLLDNAANLARKRVLHGVYLATHGPTYETPAEIRAFRAMGAPRERL